MGGPGEVPVPGCRAHCDQKVNKRVGVAVYSNVRGTMSGMGGRNSVPSRGSWTLFCIHPLCFGPSRSSSFSIWEGTLCSCRSLPVLREKESSRDTDPLCGASSLFSQAKVVLFNEVTIPRTFFFFFSEENPNSGPSVR